MALVFDVMADSSRSGIDIEGVRIDVDKDRTRAKPGDAAGGRKEREWRGHDFVARADVECHQRREQCIRSRRDTDRMRDVEKRCQFTLETLDLWPQDKLLRVAHTRDGLEHFGAHRRKLRLEIQKRHLLSPSTCARGVLV